MLYKLIKKLYSREGYVGIIIREFVSYYEAKKGTVDAQKDYKKSIKRGHSIRSALEVVGQRFPMVKSSSDEQPIFILSAGWRSGSTMLQRLVMSKQKILIWGEPYSHSLMLKHLSNTISAITADWPEENWFINQNNLETLDTTFVANLYPEINELQSAYLAYMQALFIESATKRGFNKWGIKDVRLNMDDARFLKWLYPKSKFLFLVRDPLNAYRSYRSARNWYYEWPKQPILTAKDFGIHWNKLAKEFYEEHADVNGLLLRHEDICTGSIDFQALESYLDIEIEQALISKKVGSHRKAGDKIPFYERNMLLKEVKHVAQKYDYKL